MSLQTTYLGLSLRSPLVASSSPLSETLDGIKSLEDGGAAAVVLFSLFEEQITMTRSELMKLSGAGTGGYARAAAMFPEHGRLQLRPADYLEHIRSAKEATKIPIIASLNGAGDERLITYARLVEQAGADALELNLYSIPTDEDLPARAIEDAYVELVHAIKAEISIPLAIKLSPYFTNFSQVARRLDNAGANALVLFNRFYQPDVDLEERRVRPSLELSTSTSLRLPLRWIAILESRLSAELAATSGIHRAEDAIKAIAVGAQVAMMCSALLKHGPARFRAVEADMRGWMDAHEMSSLDALRGTLGQKAYDDPAAYERAQYLMSLESWDPSSKRGR